MAKGSPVLALTLIVLGLGASNLKPPFSQISDGPRGPAEPYGTVTATVTPPAAAWLSDSETVTRARSDRLTAAV